MAMFKYFRDVMSFIRMLSSLIHSFTFSSHFILDRVTVEPNLRMLVQSEHQEVQEVELDLIECLL